MLDADLLDAFLAVAETRHFGHAADALGTVQSVVSKRLARLEDVLGTRLIERGRRNRIELTRAGALFVAEAQAARAALHRALRVGQGIARGTSGPLRLGYVFSAALTGVLRAVLTRLAAQFPDADVRPAVMESPRQLAALAAGELDLALLRPRPAWPAGLVTRVVHEEPYAIACAADSALATGAEFTPQGVIDACFIVPQFSEPQFAGDVGQAAAVAQLAAAASAPMPRMIRTDDYLTAAAMAAAGLGVVLAPASLARLNLDGLAVRPLSGFAERAHLVLAARAEIDPALVAAAAAGAS